MSFTSKKQEKTVSEPVSALMKLAAKTRPRKRNSKLDPYLYELRELQSQGYSLAQMEEFLGQINVVVSRQTIHDFLKRRAKTQQITNTNKETTKDNKKTIEEPQKATARNPTDIRNVMKQEIDLDDYTYTNIEEEDK
jgi:protein subunit release factor A